MVLSLLLPHPSSISSGRGKSCRANVILALLLAASLVDAGPSFLDDAANVQLHYDAPTSFDVLVYGATPGGVQAAVAAARENARVALVEPSVYVGGMLSGGLSQLDIGVWPRASMGQMMEFVRRVGNKYGLNSSATLAPLPPYTCDAKTEQGPPWHWEAHVAEEVFVDMLREQQVKVFLATRLLHVEKDDRTGLIKSVTTNSSLNLKAASFVDGSYEGWLMRLTPGVSWTTGREPAEAFNESVGGVLPEPTPRGVPYGATHQFQVAVSPFTDSSNTSCLPHVHCDEPPGTAPGQGDAKNGAYDYRTLLTSNRSNMVPLPDPGDSYDPAEFELLRRIIAKYNASGRGGDLGFHVPTDGVPNQKTDVKLGGPPGFTFEYVGGGWRYPSASWDEQQAIIAEHRRFHVCLLHFWRTDPAVPMRYRDLLSPTRIGLARDEFNRSEHWMSSLYIRSGPRLQGQVVLSQKDIVEDWRKPDVIALGSYSIDIPGAVQRIPLHGRTLLEGGLQSPSLCYRDLPPFNIPLRSIRPKSEEVKNLFVPVAISSTHVAYNAIRMEPTWMVVGQAAGVAAAMSAASGDGSTVNITRLQERLIDAGQALTLALPGKQWLAWKPAWEVVVKENEQEGGQGHEEAAAGTQPALVQPRGRSPSYAIRIRANQTSAVLKKQLLTSRLLPSSEVRSYEHGSGRRDLALAAAPKQAEVEEYWVVEVVE